MLEIVLVVAGVAALFGLSSLPTIAGLWVGAILTCLGFVGGSVAGAVYHVHLYRGLRDGPYGVPRRWWVSPPKWHHHMSEQSRPQVMRWFYAGAGGFVACLIGCAVVVAAVVKTIAI